MTDAPLPVMVEPDDTPGTFPVPKYLERMEAASGAGQFDALSGEAVAYAKPLETTLPPHRDDKERPESPEAESAFPSWFDMLRQSILHFIHGGNYWVAGGVLMMLLGCSFLATYFSDVFTLGPRLTLITLAGTAMVGAGIVLRGRVPVYALILQGGGIGIVYLSLVAAVKLPEPALLPPLVALVLVALLTIPSVALALLQEAQALAFFGFLGGFAAPFLLAAGSENFVGLFSYYLLLDIALLGICRFRIWNWVNSLGALCTFGVLGLWIARFYQPSMFLSAEPFVLGFTLIFLLITLVAARKRATRLENFQDFCRNPPETLLALGTPLASMVSQALLVKSFPYGLAFSSLAFGAFFIALPAWIWRCRGDSLRGLAQIYLAAGALLVNLTLPLAFSGRLSAALWAAEGALIFFFACKAASRPLKIAGLLLQTAAMFLCLKEPLLSKTYILLPESFILAVSALFSAYMEKQASQNEEGRIFPERLVPALLWAGFFWWFFGLAVESTHWGMEKGAFFLLTASASTLLLCLSGHFLAFREFFLSIWITAPYALAYTVFLFLSGDVSPSDALLYAPNGVPFSETFRKISDLRAQFFVGLGIAAWPVFAACIGVFFALGKRHCEPLARFWLLLLLPAQLVFVLTSSCRALAWSMELSRAWESFAGIFPSFLYVLVAVLLMEKDLRHGRKALPLPAVPRGYTDKAVLFTRIPVLLFAALGAWALFGLFSRGDPAPLSLYIPLLNPLELEQTLCLGLFFLWRVKSEEVGYPLPPFLNSARLHVCLGLFVFLLLHSIIFRCVYFYADIRIAYSSLFASSGLEVTMAVARERVFQTLLTALWGICGLGSIIWGNRHRLRPFWAAGVGLIVLDTAKLFFLDLADKTTIYRIISFFVVGGVFLCIGLLAPLPPAAKPATIVSGDEPEGEKEHA